MKKLKYILIIMLSIVVTSLPLEVNASTSLCVEYSNGSGTEEDPYQITNKYELNSIRCNQNSNFILKNNIEFNDADFSALGDFYNDGKYFEPISTFYGVLDGNGYTISGLRENNSNIGLIDRNHGTIKNLKIQNFQFKVNDENVTIYANETILYIGTITAYNGGTIENCHNISSLDFNSNLVVNNVYVGGIAGYNSGTIVKSSNSKSLNVVDLSDENIYVGGITGFNIGGEVIYSINNGKITATFGDNRADIGGLIGYNLRGTASYLSNNGGVYVITDYLASVGGIIGDNYTGELRNSYNTAKISNYSSHETTVGALGGVVGSNSANGYISDCYTIGLIEGEGIYSGFIVGFNNDEPVYRTYTMYGDTTMQGSSNQCLTCYSLKTLASPMLESSYGGFNFDEIWEMGNEEYPFPVIKNLEMISLKENNQDYDGGSGILSNPYRISTKQHLNNIRKNPYSYYILTNDIVFDDSDFNTSGYFYNDGKYFKPISHFYGILDGQNYTIKNLKINNFEDENIGLFGVSEGIVRNIGLVNLDIKTLSLYVGGVIGINRGDIINVYSLNSNIEYDDRNTTTNYTIYVGGIAGTAGGNIKNVFHSGNINVKTLDNSRDTYVGGIVGSNNGIINSSYNEQSIIVDSNSSVFNYIGGISGSNSYMGGITDCYNAADISFTNNKDTTYDYFGGISGTVGSVRKIENSYNVGDLYISSPSSKIYSGEIVGSSNSSSNVNNTYYLQKDNNLTSTYGKALTSEQMTTKTSFTGFNFNTIWSFSSKGYEYPILISAKINPVSPVLESKTDESFILKAVEGYEYSIDGENWQDSNEFNNLETNIEYTVYQRIKETENAEASKISGVLKVPLGTPNYPLESISLNKTSETKEIGEKVNLIVTYKPTNTTDDKTVVWTSSNLDVATVNDGEVVAVGAGTATITASVNGKTATYKITVPAISITDAIITLSKTDFDYTGVEIEPNIIVQVGDKTLSSETDYIISYKNNIDIGTATIVITGKGNYTGSKSKYFRIVEPIYPLESISLNKTSGTKEIGESEKLTVTYNPENTTDDKTVIWTTSDSTVATVTDGEIKAVGIGTATITASANGKIATYKITVTAISIIDASLTLEKDNYTYTGNEIKPNIKLSLNDKELTTDDYEISYNNNINVGTGKIIITGKGIYKGTIEKEFTITEMDLTSAIATLEKDSYTYTGNEIKPNIKISLNDKELIIDDYEITYENNINVGTGKIIITGKGNYKGTIEKEFTITEIDITSAIATLEKDSYTYTGKEIKPLVKVSLDDKELSTNDYEITYENNINVGTGKIIITGKGNYHGSIEKQFLIINPLKNISLNKSNLTLTTNQIKNLIVIYNPTNTTDSKEVIWTSSAEKVVTVDDEGNITAISTGIATITATSVHNHNIVATCEIRVVDYLIGDINEDGSITITDVITLLRTYLNINEETDGALKFGDMNGDGKITITDVIMLLRTYLGLN